MQKDYVDKCGDLRYLELMPCTSVQGVNKWREDSLRAAKEETLRRLGRRASLPASEQEGLEETINDVFDAHSFLQGRSIETAYTESLNIAEPVKRNLIDTPDANGVATGPRCGEHCYDVPLTGGLPSPHPPPHSVVLICSPPPPPPRSHSASVDG